VIADNFNIEKIGSTTFRIKEKDGSISNKTFLNLVNFILHNIDIVDIKESVWADIHRRSNGEQERKEDDINLMGEMDLYDYIDINLGDDLEYYNTGPFVQNTDDSIVVEVIEDVSIYYSYIKEEPHSIFIFPYHGKKIDATKLEDDFYVEKRGRGYKITEKDGTICNKTYIRLIKFFIDNKDSITESVWSDIHKRSNGTTVRKEDSFNPEYIDFGENTTVYWAKDNLIIDDKDKFYFEDVENYNNNGWRLPTLEEVKQVDFSHVRKSWYRDDDNTGYVWLEYPAGTLRIKTEESIYGFHAWTKDRHEKWQNFAYDYGYDNMSKFNIDFSSIHQNRLYVFLVKDK
jgi:hypothetical protein